VRDAASCLRFAIYLNPSRPRQAAGLCSGSSLDDRSPAPWDGLPGGLIGRFERDGDVPARSQKQGHLQQGVADGHGFDEGAHAHLGFVSGQGQRLSRRSLVFLVGQRLPDRPVDPVGISAGGRNQIENEQVDILIQ